MEAAPNTLGSILSSLVTDPAERAAYLDDPEGFLAARGFPGLPDRALGEAVCQVADTLPASVAEQLAPQVMALSPLTTVDVTASEPGGAHELLDALATVPAHGLFDSDLASGFDAGSETVIDEPDLPPTARPAGGPPGDGPEVVEEDDDGPGGPGDARAPADAGFGIGGTVEELTDSFRAARASTGFDDLDDLGDLGSLSGIGLKDPTISDLDSVLDSIRSAEAERMLDADQLDGGVDGVEAPDDADEDWGPDL